MKPLAGHLAEIGDPRSPRGQTYPFVAMMLQVVVATLAGADSVAAISRFGRLRGVPFAHAVGYRSGRTPCKNAFALLLRRLPVARFEAALAAFLLPRLEGQEGLQHLAMDGKTLRGSRRAADPAADRPGLPGAHLLALYAPKAKAVVMQLAVDAKTNEHKAALELLGMVGLEGKVVTGDAAFCQKDVAAAVKKKAGTTCWR